MLAILACVIFSASSTPAPGVDADIWVAPRLSPIPQGMGLPVETVAGATQCITEAGTWLPLDRGNAVKMMLAECIGLPGRCQARLTAAKILSEPPRAFAPWMVAVIAAGALVLGVVIGGVAAR